MTGNLNTLFRLSKAQVKPAARVLARVFQDEPAYMYLSPDDSKRKRNLHYHFALRLRCAIAYGEVYATSPDMEGIAMWLPSEYARMTRWASIRGGGFSVVLNLGMQSTLRQSSTNNFIRSIQAKHAPFQHWYFASIGVDTAYQGKGYASALIKPMLARIDSEHLPCYLETQKANNVSLYQHYGFEVVNEASIPGTGLTNWAMLRQSPA